MWRGPVSRLSPRLGKHVVPEHESELRRSLDRVWECYVNYEGGDGSAEVGGAVLRRVTGKIWHRASGLPARH